ncbi:RSP_2648 family PIN domain-containing protein [Oceaniglobus indicus]|uniref:RSP_2648 family PIN domain-containing protein n=1 Tax=Oceaniglobus indicus TaxID=2047749 RepID=UPI000C19CEDB|nr:PIN domain-containing protein [Oceaniglobus indicus]
MRAVLDANVLFPTVLREILIGVAAAGVYRPLWSPRILEEWARATNKLGPGAEDVARGEIALLRAAWPEASVLPRDGDLARLWLPDADDVHVLAAAVAGSADVIVTLNARDFPRHILSEEGVSRQDADQFLRSVWDGNADAVARVVRQVHAKAEELSGETLELRALLKRARLPRFARLLT